MKRFDTSIVKTALLACVIAVVLTGFYCAGALCFDSNIGCSLQTDSLGQGDQGNLPWNYASNPQNGGTSSECVLACSLPDGWQAGLSGGKLWITHYNPDGSVADSLPFDSVESLSNWVEAHPDCCDVDVDKLVPEAPKDTVPVSRAELIK
ncbi:MAG: hypothetical protein ISS70_22805 [Phycisphaerae bacterium]|nr:hypothetical protein [Phycisphaerae bacterium]